MNSVDKDQAPAGGHIVDGLHSAAQSLLSAAGAAYAHGEDNAAAYLRDVARSLLSKAHDFEEES